MYAIKLLSMYSYCMYVRMYCTNYSTAQMQLHTRSRVLACLHTCANMCPVTRDGTLMSLTIHVCYTNGCTHAYAAQVDTYVGTYTCATRVSPTCSKQSLRRIDVCSLHNNTISAQSAYSSDIISGYSEWASVVIKILTSCEMCIISLLVSKRNMPSMDGLDTDRWVVFCNFRLFVISLYKYSVCGHWCV